MISTDEAHRLLDAHVFALQKEHAMQLHEKRTSLKWKAAYYLTFMFLWNKKFMTKYWTTDGVDVWVPDLSDWASDKRVFGSYVVMRHEGVHMDDYSVFLKKYGRVGGRFVWRVLYLSPQIFALLGLLAFFNLWWLLALVFLLPWPSPFREWAELRGYGESIRAIMDVTEKPFDDDDIRWMVEKNFTSMAYFKMSWNKKKVIRRLTEVRDEHAAKTRKV